VNSHRQLLRRMAASFSVVLIAAACTSGATQAPTQPPSPTNTAASATEQPTPTPPPPRATVRVSLNWPVPEYTHTGITMAQARGYYEDENLDVQLEPLSGSTASVQAVGSGAAEIGFAGAGAIVAGLSQDVPIIVVANHLQNAPIGVLYRSGLTVNSFADLKGLSIATQATGEDAVALPAFLKDAGLDPETDVDIQVVDGAVKCTLLLAGTVDACTGFSTGQLVRAHEEDPDIGFIAFGNDHIKLIGHSVIVNTDWLKSNEDVVRRFLLATYRGYLEADSNLHELAQIYTTMYPENGIDLYEQSAIEAHKLMHSDRTDAHGWGWMEDQPWQDYQGLLFKSGTITKETPVSQIYTNAYLPANAPF
jgi:NitT/TauT family transport system substrate-binding protein